MTVAVLDEQALAAVDSLISDYEHKPYRHYRVYSRKAQAAILREELAGTARRADGLVLHAEDSNGASLVVGRTLDWDTRFFGVPMARIEYVLGDEGPLRRQLVERAIARLVERGIQHISARVDVADIALLTLLESLGFRLMDCLVTYTTRPHKEPPNAVREVGHIRDFRPDDQDQLLAITESAYRGFRGRFHLDPHLPDERCDAFYAEWARQCLSGVMADTVLVSEGSDGQLLGFLAYRRREPVSSIGGVPVFGGGLGACRVDTPGAYAGLIRAGTIRAHERGGVAECQTQNYNFPTIRIYEAVGAHYVRGEYTLHRWLAS